MTPYGRGTIRAGSLIWSTVGAMDLRDSQTKLTKDWAIKEGRNDNRAWWRRRTGPLATDRLSDSVNDFTTLWILATLTQEPYSLSELGNDPADYYYDFEILFWALGTYKAVYEITGRLSGTTYTGSGTYTFHVGPIADLEVRDTGASPEVDGSQRAYTIMAVNNGPQAAPAVEVTLTGVPQGAQAIASEGDYDSVTGVWTIGELSASDPRASGLAGHPTLTLVTARGGDPVMATIESTEDYCVRIKTGATATANDLGCVGSLPTGYTEHSAAYYDYIAGNNTAMVQARAGTATARE